MREPKCPVNLEESDQPVWERLRDLPRPENPDTFTPKQLFQRMALHQEPDDRVEKEILFREKNSFKNNRIITLRTGSLGSLILMHTVSGTLFDYQGLIHRLDSRLEIVGIPYQPLLQPDINIESIAEKYSETILQSFGAKPILLAGYSFGGIVAFEIAHQIEKRGGHVVFIGLLDSFLDENPKPSKYNNCIEFTSNLPEWIVNDMQHVRLINWFQRLKKAYCKIKRQISPNSSKHLRQVDEVFNLTHASPLLKSTVQSHLNAIDLYRPVSIHCKISYFRAKVRPLFQHYRPERAWRRYSLTGLDCYEIPGNHWSLLMQEKSLDTLGKSIEAALPWDKITRIESTSSL